VGEVDNDAVVDEVRIRVVIKRRREGRYIRARLDECRR